MLFSAEYKFFLAYYRTVVTEITFTSVFKDNKLLKSCKTVEIYFSPKFFCLLLIRIHNTTFS